MKAEVRFSPFLHGLLIFAAICMVIYVANGWSPSHYAYAGKLLGLPDVHPLLGVARSIRSDEWGVSTPYFQIAAANDFGPINLHSPFHEPLKAFFALPSRDWSMVFKPDLWGFLLLDPARAFSLHYALLTAAMIGGFWIFLRQLGASPVSAFAGALLINLCQFTQVWWTSDAAVLAWAPWAPVLFLWRASWWVRLPVIAYAVAVWLIGELYPPFIVAAAIAFVTLIAAFQPKALSPGRLVVGFVGAGLGAAIAWAHFADLIPIMSATIYPGTRSGNGGGLTLFQMLAHGLPSLATTGFQPLGLWPSNECEVGVVGSILPLAVACFANRASLRAWFRSSGGSLLILIGALDLLAAWCLFPLPGLDLVPGYRMVWAFGLIFLLALVLIADRLTWRITRFRIIAFLGVIVATWGLKSAITHRVAVHWFDLAPAAVLIGLLCVRRLAPRLMSSYQLVLGAAVATAALTFATFNPLQPAQQIFQPQQGQFVNSLRKYAEVNPQHLVVLPGWYGATLNGLGVPSVNHVMLRPALSYFRRYFPEMPKTKFDQVFNRYAHTTLFGETIPRVLQDDGIGVPIYPFAIPLTVNGDPIDESLIISKQCSVDAIEGRLWRVTLSGQAPWRGVEEGQALGVRATQARIISAIAVRLPASPDKVQEAPAFEFAPRFAVTMVVESAVKPSGETFVVRALGLPKVFVRNIPAG